MNDPAGCVSPASILLEIGWPAKALNPNSREHFMTKHRFAKASKDSAYWATKAAIGRAKIEHDGERRVQFIVTAYPPDNRARDDDNLIASMKSHRDGIAKALGIDDQYFDQRLQWAEPIRLGKLVIEVRL